MKKIILLSLLLIGCQKDPITPDGQTPTVVTSAITEITIGKILILNFLK